jgi:uncharacterized BrkB/YihY/UPF0761 family membrane protein
VKLRRPIGWVLLALGSLFAILEVAALLEIMQTMEHFGMLSHWDTIKPMAPVLEGLATGLAIGVGVASLGGWLVTRKQRPAGPPASSHFT